MTLDIEHQVRNWIAELDELLPEITADQVTAARVGTGAVRPMRPIAPSAGRPRRWVVALSAAVAALVIIGGVALLFRTTGGDQPVVATTVPEATVVDTAPEATVVDTAPEATVPDGLIQIGEVTWTKVATALDPHPFTWRTDPGGGFVAFEHPYVWRSDDAITWTRTMVDPELVSYDAVTYSEDGAWAIGFSATSGFQGIRTLLSRASGSWEVVAVPKPALSGVRWGDEWADMLLWVEAVVGDTALVRANTPGDVPWGDYFGVFEGECGDTRCQEEPYSGYDEGSGTVEVRAPFSEALLATLTVGVEGQDVVFVDSASGATIHAIGTADSGVSPEEIVAWIRTSGDRGRTPIPPVEWRVAVSGSDLAGVVLDPPWGPQVDRGDSEFYAEVVAIPDAGAFVALDHEEDGTLTAWTSVDGRNWVERASLGTSVAHPDVVSGPGRVLVKALTGAEDPSTGLEPGIWWHSTDGITWALLDDASGEIDVQRSELALADFGYLAVLEDRDLWVSDDGSTWGRIEVPSEEQLSVACCSGAGAVGSVIWIEVEDPDSGARTTWIARVG